MSLDLDITYVVVLALFLIPVVILNGLVIRPFLALFEERHEKLAGAIDRAELMLEEAERRAATFEARIKVATEQGVDARSRIRAEAASNMNRRVDEERKRMQTKLDEALTRIAEERDRALAQVQTDAERIADAVAAKLVGRAL